MDHVREENMALRKFIIERDIPKVGTFEREQLRGAAAKSNGVLRQLGPDIQWLESYVADNKTFCVYLAKDEDIIRKHADQGAEDGTQPRAELRPVLRLSPDIGSSILAVGRSEPSAPTRTQDGH